jgi:uncharacterized protein (UPF0335 family)
MNKEKQIKSYWDRIGKLEERIQELSRRNLNYSGEVTKRKSLLTNVKRLEKEKNNEN